MSDKNDTRREFEAWFPLDKFGKNALHYSVGNYTFEPAATYWWVWQVATERATASKWRDIATAPKDESVIILGYLPHHRIDRLVYEGRWHSDQLTWTSVNGFIVHNNATHWLPLPPPPAIRQGGDT